MHLPVSSMQAVPEGDDPTLKRRFASGSYVGFSVPVFPLSRLRRHRLGFSRLLRRGFFFCVGG